MGSRAAYDPCVSRYFPVVDSPALAERVAAWTSAPAEAAAPRLAATVMCLRDATPGVEVFMLHRVRTMAFAPSMHVFPGGGVDPRDADEALPWAGPSAADWADRLGTDERTARMLVTAAVREVFEETGVLLAGAPTGDSPVPQLPEGWGPTRADLVARTRSFSDVLTEHGLVLRSDLLTYRAHWTTPVVEPRRYDTRFFAARMPTGQVADDGSSEAQSAQWSAPADVLQRWRDGAVLMLPPTVVVLEGLAAARDVDDYLASEAYLEEVMPVLVDTDEGLAMRVDHP